MTTPASLACFNDNGAGTGGVADDGIKNGDEPVVSFDERLGLGRYRRRHRLHLHQHP